MAYSDKYLTPKKKGKDGNNYRVVIQENGYTGTTDSFDINDPVANTGGGKLEEPISDTEFQVQVVQGNSGVVTDIRDSVEGDHRMVIRKNGSDFWKGILLPDRTKETKGHPNQTGTLRATDLAPLDSLYFSKDGTRNGTTFGRIDQDGVVKVERESLIDTIGYILGQLNYGFDLHISYNWVYDQLGSSEETIEELQIPLDVYRTETDVIGEFNPDKSIEVLKDLLIAHQANLRWGRNGYYINQIKELAEADYNYRRYRIDEGVDLSNGNVVTYETDVSENTLTFDGTDSNVDITRNYPSVQSRPAVERVQTVYNFEFDEEKQDTNSDFTSWEEFDMINGEGPTSQPDNNTFVGSNDGAILPEKPQSWELLKDHYLGLLWGRHSEFSDSFAINEEYLTQERDGSTAPGDQDSPVPAGSAYESVLRKTIGNVLGFNNSILQHKYEYLNERAGFFEPPGAEGYAQTSAVVSVILGPSNNYYATQAFIKTPQGYSMTEEEANENEQLVIQLQSSLNDKMESSFQDSSSDVIAYPEDTKFQSQYAVFTLVEPMRWNDKEIRVEVEPIDNPTDDLETYIFNQGFRSAYKQNDTKYIFSPNHTDPIQFTIPTTDSTAKLYGGGCSENTFKTKYFPLPLTLPTGDVIKGENRKIILVGDSKTGFTEDWITRRFETIPKGTIGGKSQTTTAIYDGGGRREAIERDGHKVGQGPFEEVQSTFTDSDSGEIPDQWGDGISQEFSFEELSTFSLLQVFAEPNEKQQVEFRSITGKDFSPETRIEDSNGILWPVSTEWNPIRATVSGNYVRVDTKSLTPSFAVGDPDDEGGGSGGGSGSQFDNAIAAVEGDISKGRTQDIAARTNEIIESGTSYSEIDVFPLPEDINGGNKYQIYDQNSSTFTEIKVVGNHSVDDQTLNIASKTFTKRIPTGSPIIASGSTLQSAFIQTDRSFSVLIQDDALTNLTSDVSGSTSSLSVDPLITRLRDGQKLFLEESGITEQFEVASDADANDTTIDIVDKSFNNTFRSGSTEVKFDTTGQLASQFSINPGSIRFESELIRFDGASEFSEYLVSDDYDGDLPDANGNIADDGTTGFILKDAYFDSNNNLTSESEMVITNAIIRDTVIEDGVDIGDGLFEGTGLEFNFDIGDNTSPTEDITIRVNRGSSTDALIEWDESEDVWKSGIEGSLTGLGGLKIDLDNDGNDEINPATSATIKNDPQNVFSSPSNNLLDIDFGPVSLKDEAETITGIKTHNSRIVLDSTQLRSSGAATGFTGSGTVIQDDLSWFDNLRIREALIASTFEVRQIRVSKGERMFSAGGGKIEAVSGSNPYTLDFAETPGITVDDLLLIKETSIDGNGFETIVKDLELNVDSVSNGGKTVTVSVNSGSSSPEVGDDVVVVGSFDSNRDSSVFIDPYIPAVDLLDNINSFNDWNNRTPKVRVGDINGMPNLSDGTAPSGNGLFATNIYLEGSIVSSNGEIGDWTIESDRISSGNLELVASGSVKNTNGAWALNNDGTANIGDTAGSEFLEWDGSSLNVNGTVTITGGSGVSNLSDAGGLATQDNADWASDVTGSGKPEDNATLGADLATNVSNTVASNISATIDRKWASESGADVTGNNTAQDIVNQGSLATQNNADWTDDITGTNKPADNADVTANNTAQDIVNQGDFATISKIDTTNNTTFIGNGAIVTDFVASEAIRANEIAADTITANEIAADTIGANLIISDSVLANDILANNASLTGNLTVGDGNGNGVIQNQNFDYVLDSSGLDFGAGTSAVNQITWYGDLNNRNNAKGFIRGLTDGNTGRDLIELQGTDDVVIDSFNRAVVLDPDFDSFARVFNADFEITDSTGDPTFKFFENGKRQSFFDARYSKIDPSSELDQGEGAIYLWTDGNNLEVRAAVYAPNGQTADTHLVRT